jgi:hypothetical protein
VGFVAGSRFAFADVVDEHPVHDTQIKRLRHLALVIFRALGAGSFIQHECYQYGLCCP